MAPVAKGRSDPLVASMSANGATWRFPLAVRNSVYLSTRPAHDPAQTVRLELLNSQRDLLRQNPWASR